MEKPQNIDAYISTFPESTQILLEEIRSIIQKAAPEAVEIISYAMPSYLLNGNLVHFAGYKNHIGFYPGAAGVISYFEEVSNYKNGKGSVQFPLNKPLPTELITKIVKFRVEQNLNKAESKMKTK
jgi:uncharacterized protein YdhG (YjbR/CyaY superfamily)